MSFDLIGLHDAVTRHRVVGRILVVSHAGSVPRDSGTSMLVWGDGQSGTIGGGALEFNAVSRLRSRLDQGGVDVRKMSLGPALNQCCGGAVTLISEVFNAADLALIGPQFFTRRVSGNGEKPLELRRAEAALRNGQVGGAVFADGWLSEPVTTLKTPLWVYGAGHVGRAIVAVMAPLPEFGITWIDTDAARFPAEVPKGVTVLPTPEPAASVALAPAQAHHLVLTYSHALDLELCHQLLRHGFEFAGLIGSKTKWARFRSRLAALGHAPAEISSICCPIGQPELGKHPQAIALGVASQLVMRSARAREMGERETA